MLFKCCTLYWIRTIQFKHCNCCFNVAFVLYLCMCSRLVLVYGVMRLCWRCINIVLMLQYVSFDVGLVLCDCGFDAVSYCTNVVDIEYWCGIDTVLMLRGRSWSGINVALMLACSVCIDIVLLLYLCWVHIGLMWIKVVLLLFWCCIFVVLIVCWCWINVVHML